MYNSSIDNTNVLGARVCSISAPTVLAVKKISVKNGNLNFKICYVRSYGSFTLAIFMISNHYPYINKTSPPI